MCILLNGSALLIMLIIYNWMYPSTHAFHWVYYNVLKTTAYPVFLSINLFLSLITMVAFRMGQLLHIDQISHLKITNILFVEFFFSTVLFHSIPMKC